MRGFLRGLPAAVLFLTRLPWPAERQFTDEDFSWATAWFPLVGLLIGAVTVLTAYLGVLAVSPAAAAVLALIAVWLLTGGLHIDGLMDTADGLMGSRDRLRSLEIMRDSRVGAMGAAAGILMLLLKAALTAELIGLHCPSGWVALLLAPVFGRWAIAYGVSVYPYARPEGGLGTSFVSDRRLIVMGTATVLTLAAAWIGLGVPGLAAGAVTAAAAAAAAALMAGRLQGLTGDTYGAMNEITEAIALLTMTALINGLHLY